MQKGRSLSYFAPGAAGRADDLRGGKTLFEANRLDDALPLLQRAAAIGDTKRRATALGYLGTTQFRLKQFAEAAESFGHAIEMSSGKPRLYYNRANALLALGRSADAKEEYERALALDPNYEEAREALVVVAADLIFRRSATETPTPAPEAESRANAEPLNPAEFVALDFPKLEGAVRVTRPEPPVQQAPQPQASQPQATPKVSRQFAEPVLTISTISGRDKSRNAVKMQEIATHAAALAEATQAVEETRTRLEVQEKREQEALEALLAATASLTR